MFPLQAPQQRFGLWDMMAGYNRSRCEYADGTGLIYGNNQWSWPVQQQPTYLPNFVPHPSWFSPGSGITLLKTSLYSYLGMILPVKICLLLEILNLTNLYSHDFRNIYIKLITRLSFLL